MHLLQLDMIILVNEIIEYDKLSVELVLFWKNNWNLTYRQNMLPINLDDD